MYLILQLVVDQIPHLHPRVVLKEVEDHALVDRVQSVVQPVVHPRRNDRRK